MAEGAEADAFYVIVSGSARVLRRTGTGAKSVAREPRARRRLRRDRAARRTATGPRPFARAARSRRSGSTKRLPGASFGSNPRSRITSSARPSAVACATSSASRPALRIDAGHARLAHRRPRARDGRRREVVVRQGEASNSDVLRRERAAAGRLAERGRRARATSPTSGEATSSASTRCFGAPGARSVEAVTPVTLLASARATSSGSPQSDDGFRDRRSRSRSPTTTSGSSPASRSISPRSSCRPSVGDAGEGRPGAGRRGARRAAGRRADGRGVGRRREAQPAPSGSRASRTSGRSTRWTAAPPAWRWSAATSGGAVSLPHIRQARPHWESTARASTGIARRRRGGRSARPLREGVEDPARRAAASRRLPLRRQPLGRALRVGRTARAPGRPGARRRPDEARGVRGEWSGYAALLAYGPGLEEAPARRRRRCVWLWQFFRPFARHARLSPRSWRCSPRASRWCCPSSRR